MPAQTLSPFVDASLDAARVRSAVATLTDVQRQAVELTYFGGSYATYVGTVYASMFPRRTRALALPDGLVTTVFEDITRERAEERERHRPQDAERGALVPHLEVLGCEDEQHLAVLEEAGLLVVEKGYEGKRPKTWVSVTAAGTVLSEIIAHLLEKEPDRRYQTAEGLLFDLERLREYGAQAVVY